MNNLRFAILTLLLGSFVVSQVSAQTSPSPTPVVVPLAQAIEGLEGHRSSAARKLGHYGTVHILLRNGADGKVIDASISESSGSDILDSGALTAIRKLTFEPKKDSSGKLIEFSGIVAVEFNISVEALLGYYTCEQANLDADWYLNTFPKATASDLEVFKSAQFLL